MPSMAEMLKKDSSEIVEAVQEEKSSEIIAGIPQEYLEEAFASVQGEIEKIEGYIGVAQKGVNKAKEQKEERLRKEREEQARLELGSKAYIAACELGRRLPKMDVKFQQLQKEVDKLEKELTDLSSDGAPVTSAFQTTKKALDIAKVGLASYKNRILNSLVKQYGPFHSLVQVENLHGQLKSLKEAK